MSESAEFVPRVETPWRKSHELVLPVTLPAAEQVALLSRCHVVYNLKRSLSRKYKKVQVQAERDLPSQRHVPALTNWRIHIRRQSASPAASIATQSRAGVRNVAA